MSGTVRRHLWVRGRVQGVWFRESCRSVAVDVGVSGWVRNLSDGRVEAVLEGPEAAVARVEAWCNEGPARARVDGIEAVSEEPDQLSGFSVR